MRSLIDELELHSDPIRAEHSLRFFKTGPGEYGEGDTFIGITMPMLRKVCASYRDISELELQKLLDSPIHEHRMAAVVLMADTFKKASHTKKQSLFDLYIKNLNKSRINNWDLIDVSCPHVTGSYAVEHGHEFLYKLANSSNLWEKRVAIISTFAFLKTGVDEHTYKIAEILIDDKHDLIQKAVGWALREAGKRVSEVNLLEFLDEHYKNMPRTALRYAIERLDGEQRAYYMGK